MSTFDKSDTNGSSGRSKRSDAARIVASFRQDKATTVERYTAFAVTRAYLAEKSEAFAGREATRRLGAILGYNPDKGSFLDKFERHVNEFNNLARAVPYAYLDAIGADRSELEVCLEADLARYYEECEKPRFPTTAAIRYIPTIYGSVRFPLGTTEEEAIRILQNEEHARFMRFIVYDELLSIRIPKGADSRPEYSWFRPRWAWKRSWLEAYPRPGRFGVTRIR